MTENDASKPKDPNARPQDASKDNGAQDAPINPRNLSIARAHGRQIAQADTEPPVAHLHKKLRPAKRAAQARASHKAGAISREQAAVYLGVGYSTLEKLAARGEGPFCFRVGNLVRYPVDELEAWKRANDARQPPTEGNDGP
jgi:excisionase family DNA binding protein